MNVHVQYLLLLFIAFPFRNLALCICTQRTNERQTLPNKESCLSCTGKVGVVLAMVVAARSLRRQGLNFPRVIVCRRARMLPSLFALSLSPF